MIHHDSKAGAMAEGWSKSACITTLQLAAERLGRTPRSKEFDEMEGPSASTVATKFGSWNEALLAAGLPLTQAWKVDIPDDAPDRPAHRTMYVKGYRARLVGESREPPYSKHGAGRRFWLSGWDAADERCSELEREAPPV